MLPAPRLTTTRQNSQGKRLQMPRPRTNTLRDRKKKRDTDGGAEDLRSRIILHNIIGGNIGVPGSAGAVHGIVVDQRGNLAVPLDELEREALGRVPSDVAMHQPGARVVSDEGNDQVAGAGQHGDVAAGRVAEVQWRWMGCGTVLVVSIMKYTHSSAVSSSMTCCCVSKVVLPS